MQMTTEKRPLSVADVVQLARRRGRPMSPQRIRQLADAGTLNGRRVSVRGQEAWEFDDDEVRRFLRAKRLPGRPRVRAVAV